MRVYLTSLGCKLNQAEMEATARRLAAAGYELAPRLDEADLHLINSCTVTHAAARDSRKVARRGRRVNPAMRTVLTGCYATDAAQEAAALAGVDLVVDNRHKHQLVERIAELLPPSRPLGADGPLPLPYVPLDFGHSRALVKIEDGCNMRCAFCIIPFTRGEQRSRPAREVVDEVRRLATGGFAEVVVTGVQISSYRWRDQGLFELTRRLLEETPVRRLRLTSIAPWQFDRRLLDLFDGAHGHRLCRHFHLSLQSGCDETLRRMRRPYTGAAFADLAAEIRERVPGVAITTDLIVGFPGETDDEFARSLARTRELAFAKIHAFPYSERSGTAAAEMPDQVDPAEKKRRMSAALQLARRSERAFWRGNLGRTGEVLWERRSAGRWLGTTDNYLPVAAESAVDLERRLTAARLVAVGAGRVRAELVEPLAPPQHGAAGTAVAL